MIAPNLCRQWQIGNTTLRARVSPCSWMHESYGLQLEITVEGGGKAYLHEESLPFGRATDADVERLIQTVMVIPCKRCGEPTFDPASVDTNRSGLCESCFMEDLTSEWEKAEQDAREAEQAEDDAMATKGYRHKVNAWIHPEAGGDDYCARMYFKDEPTRDQIAGALNRLGSSVTDDYEITPLTR